MTTTANTVPGYLWSYLTAVTCGLPCPLTLMADEHPIDRRKAAEVKIERMLDWPLEEQALLFHMLAVAGWTRDRAKSELVKVRWWL